MRSTTAKVRRESIGRRLYRVVRRWALVGSILLLLGWVTGSMERLFYQPTSGPTPPPAGVERVRFRSSDGTALCGWFIPARSNIGPAPSILHVHGNAGNIADHQWFTAYLPAEGFNVFLFDYRGYGESEGRPRRRADLLADAHAALDTLLARVDVDTARVAIYGHSLGGAIGLNLMADRPEVPVGIFESAFDSWPRVAANAIGGDPPVWIASWLARIVVPGGHAPIDAIARIDRPVLLLHGDADRVVPISHARRLSASGGERTELLVLDGGEHNTLRSSHPEVESRVVAFLRMHLAAQ